MAGYDDADLRAAVAAAIRAPSLHNSQPWRFRLSDGAITVLTDPDHRLTVADRTGWAGRIAGGAATYNARLALAVRGRPAAVALRPEPGVVARLTPGRPRPPTGTERDLAAAVPRRHSNRRPFHTAPVPAGVRSRLVAAARAEGAWLELLVGMTALTGFAEIARSADRVLRRDPGYAAELVTWAHADVAADGVPAAAGGPVGEPQDLLPVRPYGTTTRAPGRDFEPEPLVAVLGCAGDSAVDQVVAGQALQRVLLTAQDAGLAASMISQPIEVPVAREQLRRALGRRGWPQMAVRVGYGATGAVSSRRTPEDVIVH